MRKSDTKNKLYKVAIYIRLSREDGDKEESNSITNQRMMLNNYINMHDDLTLYDEYCDDGYTGTNFERPAFKRMIQDIESGLVNCVLVKDLSRFGRDYINVGNYVERYFVDHDIRFIAKNEQIDSLQAPYDMLLPIRNIFNQQYALDISQKVQSSFKVKQREGQFIGAFPSYGYKRNTTDKNKLVIDDYAADIVRRIYSLYADGIGKIRIANILNEENILCPSEYKKQCGFNYKNSNKMNTTSYWTFSTISKILQNQMYHGDMVQGKTKRRMKGKAQYLSKEDWIIVEDTHPAIIDDELWNRVQRTLKRDTRNIDFNQNVSVFAGFLKCGDCGRALAKNISIGQIHYVCSTYKNYGKGKCSSHRVNHKDLEKIILEDLNLIISSVQDMKNMVDKQSEEQLIDKMSIQRAIADYDAKIAKLESNKKASYSDYREEIITKSEYIEYKNECDNKISLIIQKKENLQENIHEDRICTPWIEKLLATKEIKELDKEIIDEMIDKIYVYEDKTIKIVYNFSDELELLLAK
jgi:site-specific DNA recombinase